MATSRPFSASRVPKWTVASFSGAGGTAGRPSVTRARKRRPTPAVRRAVRKGCPFSCCAAKETNTAVARSPLAARFQTPPTCQAIGSVMFTQAKAMNARNTPKRGRCRATTSS
ncbi:MAG: hypothetical protein IPN03_20970 [Holophagales bacterium]|nr:hypothetical protein [Holophagales bacterium]